jgi:hypothetical protein
MKKILALYGTANIGKTETIKLVFEKLKNEYKDFEYHSDFEPIMLEKRDICVIIIIKGKIIGIESQGDPNSRIFESLPLFKRMNCDIIVCATRTKGATVGEVEKLQDIYQIEWINKNSPEYSDNKKTASELYNRINSIINV